MTSLAERAAQFARELEDTLNGVLPGYRRVVGLRAEGAQRFVIRPEDQAASKTERVPLYVQGELLAELSISEHLDLDRTSTHLKTVRSDFRVFSVLDRTPLLRLEYRADMATDPISHWQVHAERGAFSHLLTRANEHRPGRVRKPHDLSSLHLPVGGERFRPCIEDLLQFLVVDCGVDHREGWRAMVENGREQWRRRQLGAAVRDAPSEAVRVLKDLGWTVEPPSSTPPEYVRPLRTW